MDAARPRFIVVLAVWCLAALAVGGAGRLLAGSPTRQPRGGAEQPAPQQPTFRAGVSAVRVDVIVTDPQGMPVDTLRADDFEVLEDGKPRTIDSCRLIRVLTREEPGGEAPRAIRTFEDEETELARDDVRIIVILLDDYHVSHGNALNLRPWLHRFIDRQVGPYDVVALMYPMTPTSAMTFTRDKFALGSVIDRFDGRQGDYIPRNQVESNSSMEPPWRIEQIRSEVVASAITSACYHLGSLNEGRKSLLVVADHLAVAGGRLQEMIDAANRSNVAIYALNAAGVGAFGMGDVLRSLAEETNGRSITARNDVEAALAVLLRDSSAYYLLGYNSDKGADGKFHQIKVRLKKPGLDVRARKGYWAPTAAEAARAAEPPKPAAPPPVTSALGGLSAAHGRSIAAWLGVSRGAGGNTRLTFVYEPVAANAGGREIGRVVLVASAAGGAKYFEGPVGEPPPAAAGGIATLAVSRRAVFEAPPGRIQLKVTVEGPTSSADVIETETRDLVVPDLSGPRVALSTPAVFSARTPREFRELVSDATAIPTVNRQFSRSDRLLIRFDVYGAGATASASLLNRHGDAMTALPVSAGSRPTEHTIELPLSQLARGDYLVQVTGKGETGEATALVAVRVAG